MTPRTEPPAVDVVARPIVRMCRTVISKPRRALMTGWRLAIIAAIDAVIDDFRGLDEIEVENCNDGLRLVVESVAGYDAAEIARGIKARALTRCAS